MAVEIAIVCYLLLGLTDELMMLLIEVSTLPSHAPVPNL